MRVTRSIGSLIPAFLRPRAPISFDVMARRGAPPIHITVAGRVWNVPGRHVVGTLVIGMLRIPIGRKDPLHIGTDPVCDILLQANGLHHYLVTLQASASGIDVRSGRQSVVDVEKVELGERQHLRSLQNGDEVLVTSHAILALEPGFTVEIFPGFRPV